jgi:acetyltransferase-like isoleucine patch superfamily enzyme
MKRALKSLANGVSLVLVSPLAATCWLERRLSRRGEHVFAFWSHVVAQGPGLPGLYLRRAFYQLTLDHCAPSFYIGFGAFFSHRQARVAENVYIGPYAIVGSADLGTHCLIGSRVSILSGPDLHELDEDGNWTASRLDRMRQVQIGHHAWIGEAAVIMADVGERTMVAAGAVVSSAVPAGVVVAGNPARFVRQIGPARPAPAVGAGLQTRADDAAIGADR